MTNLSLLPRQSLFYIGTPVCSIFFYTYYFYSNIARQPIASANQWDRPPEAQELGTLATSNGARPVTASPEQSEQPPGRHEPSHNMTRYISEFSILPIAIP